MATQTSNKWWSFSHLSQLDIMINYPQLIKKKKKQHPTSIYGPGRLQLIPKLYCSLYLSSITAGLQKCKSVPACQARRNEKEQNVLLSLQKGGLNWEYWQCQASLLASTETRRKCRAWRHIGQTHPLIHILKSACVLTATIKPVLSTRALALWLCCWRCEQWCRLLQAIKQGGGNYRVKVAYKTLAY